jgi:hypothetical protein
MITGCKFSFYLQLALYFAQPLATVFVFMASMQRLKLKKSKTTIVASFVDRLLKGIKHFKAGKKFLSVCLYFLTISVKNTGSICIPIFWSYFDLLLC